MFRLDVASFATTGFVGLLESSEDCKEFVKLLADNWGLTLVIADDGKSAEIPADEAKNTTWFKFSWRKISVYTGKELFKNRDNTPLYF